MVMVKDKGTATKLDKVATQRDRFIAFAFAAADLLIEADSDGRIVYAAGMSDAICGVPLEALTARRITDLVVAEDRPLLDECMHRLRRVGRLGKIRIRVEPSPGDARPVSVSGINLPSTPDLFHLAINRYRRVSSAGEPPVITKDNFATVVGEKIQECEITGDELALTLLEIPQTALTGLSADGVSRFVGSLRDYLRAWSVEGEYAVRLGDRAFGVLHEAGIDKEVFCGRVSDLVLGLDPDQTEIAIGATTIPLQAETLEPGDIEKSLVYTINQFVEQGGKDFSIDTLADAYQAAMECTLTRIRHYRTLLAGSKISFAYQPIVGLGDWSVHHFEMLARIAGKAGEGAPIDMIAFAETVGIVNELDEFVLSHALEILERTGKAGNFQKLAINLSGKSICNPQFVPLLLSRLMEKRALLPRLLIEITESAEIENLEVANKVLQKIRALGCQVCLDDFGAGAAAFHYLRMLEVDHVKIDGSYILEAFSSRHGKPFLVAMSALCQKMGIETIGEMVENVPTVQLLAEIGIDYGQGYYFGKPIDRLTADLPLKPSFKN